MHQPVTEVTGLLPAATRHLIVSHTVRLPADWVTLRPGVWARETHQADTVQLIQLDRWKGSAFSFTWGLSLAFVPHRWDSKLAWHRTLRSSRLDILERAQNVAERELGPDAGWEQEICGVGGEQHFRDDIARAWTWAQPRAMGWLDATRTTRDVLRVAVEQAARRPLGLERATYPKPRMICAFAAARLGLVDEAETQLATYLATDPHETPEKGQLLRQALSLVVGLAST